MRLRGIRPCHRSGREISRSYIASGGFLTAEEGQDRVKRARIADKAVSSGVVT